MPINDNPVTTCQTFDGVTCAVHENQLIGHIAYVTHWPSFETKDSGSRAEYANGGIRDTQEGKPRVDLVFPLNVPYGEQLVTRWAALMGRGAEKYEDRNWEQFSDQAALDRAKSSAARHFAQWLTGETDEDHAAAVLFNIMAAEYVKGILAGKWKPLEAA